MSNHFTANPDYRYWGEDRHHRYDCPDNPVISHSKSKPLWHHSNRNRLLLSSDNAETERYKERVIRHRREFFEAQRLERMMLRQQRAELQEKLQKTAQGLTNYDNKSKQHKKKRATV